MKRPFRIDVDPDRFYAALMKMPDDGYGPLSGPATLHCPNPHCEDGIIRGTSGVGCSVCCAGTSTQFAIRRDATESG